MDAKALFTKLKQLDAYPKVNDDFHTRTLSGGVITIVASVLMALLFLNEARLFLGTSTIHELSVDTSRGEHIAIHLDVTLPRMPCAWLSLDAMDASGEVHIDVHQDMYKQRLGADGREVHPAVKHEPAATKKDLAVLANATAGCGSCYGAEDQAVKCCNTCAEVQEQYRKRGWAIGDMNRVEQCRGDAYMQAMAEQVGEGCRMYGNLQVSKVAGNFHIAPGRSYEQGAMHVHDLAPFQGRKLDFSHTVNSLSFGQQFPGMRNPLDKAKAPPGEGPHGDEAVVGAFSYFLKVVPTIYTPLKGGEVHTNQYSVTEHFRASASAAPGGHALPGLFFSYELSPIKIKISEESHSFLHFATNVCAILGGVFTVAGLVDAAVYHGERVLRRKHEIGKLI